MNKGDRLVCIRTNYIDSNNQYAELPLKIGDFYFVENITSKYIIVNGLAFGINEEEEYEPSSLFPLYRLRYYKYYFMTYNEWLALERKRQIKTILDDNN